LHQSVVLLSVFRVRFSAKGPYADSACLILAR
jgi:hypothetical protein